MEDWPRVNYLSSAELDPVQRNAVENSALKRIVGLFLVSAAIGLVYLLVFGV